MRRPGARFAAATVCLGLIAGAEGIAIAGHPFVTEDAETQKRGNVEVEFNLDQQHGSDGTRTTSPGNSLTMGIAPRIDLAMVYTYNFTKTRDGTKDRAMGPVEATLKAVSREGKGRMPTFGLKAGMSLPVSEGDQATVLTTAIAQWSFETVTVFANAAADIGTHLAGNDEKSTSFRSSTAGTYEVGEELYLLSELIWEKQTSPAAPSTAEWLIGAKKEFSETFNINGGIRWGLNDDSSHVTYLLGFTLGFRGEHDASPTPDGGGK